MSTFGDDNALADVTNRVANVRVDNAELAKQVGQAGWTKPEVYDYKALQHEDTAPAPDDSTAESPAGWAANAVKYEWSDEYGDVGPKHDKLEKMLFRDENQMEKGSEFSK